MSDVNSDVTSGPRYVSSSVSSSSNFETLLEMTVTDKHPRFPSLADLLSVPDCIYHGILPTEYRSIRLVGWVRASENTTGDDPLPGPPYAVRVVNFVVVICTVIHD